MCMMCISPNCCGVTIFEYSTTEVTLPSCLSVASKHVASQSKWQSADLDLVKLAQKVSQICTQSDFGNHKSEIGTISESILDFSLQKSTNRIFISEHLDCTNGKHIIEQQQIQKPEIRKKKSENKQIMQFCGQTVASY